MTTLLWIIAIIGCSLTTYAIGRWHNTSIKELNKSIKETELYKAELKKCRLTNIEYQQKFQKVKNDYKKLLLAIKKAKNKITE
jgi:hypothetical protein